MNTLNASYLGGDKFFDPATADTLGSESPTQENRWFIGFEHQGQFGNGFSTYVDYNAVSDNDYFFDFGNGGLNLSSQTHLNRQARIDFRNDYLRAGINAQRLQIIDPFAAALDINKPFDRLPQFTVASQLRLARASASPLPARQRLSIARSKRVYLAKPKSMPARLSQARV